MASLFGRQRNPNMEKALFDWPIVLQYDVKAKYRLISRKFSGMKFFHLSVRLKARLSVRSINQSNRSISVRLSFLFCSRAFISRSYENRSITPSREACLKFLSDLGLNVYHLFQSQQNRRVFQASRKNSFGLRMKKAKT